ncbi:MAG: ImmA/IrrE family metallo-endopeptidase [Xanthobacteraceae bacterium]|uniref:ImmA/IrrE family metallo-endopeptidase n=1 Tax=Pseudolabrys sp. TaxID=1960880 RepID=UPI003D0D81DE
MADTYAEAVRNGTMAAARLHVQSDTRAKMQKQGGSIDVFNAAVAENLPLLLRPLKGLLGAYLPEPTPGVLITTERPLSIQRFTAAHELGHFRMRHKPSLDNENILRRMAMANLPKSEDPEYQEVEADAFAVAYLMPRWQIEWHCVKQGWLAIDLKKADVAYQLALRLGVSYEAMTWTLQRYNLISRADGNALRRIEPKRLKMELLEDHQPKDYRGDVWRLTERDAETRIDGSRNDHFVLRLNEHSGGGYLWNIDQLRESGFAIIRDGRENSDTVGIGGPVVRHVTAGMEQGQRGAVSLNECRPWQAVPAASQHPCPDAHPRGDAEGVG